MSYSTLHYRHSFRLAGPFSGGSPSYVVHRSKLWEQLWHSRPVKQKRKAFYIHTKDIRKRAEYNRAPVYLQLIQQSQHHQPLEQKPTEKVWVGARSVHDATGHAIQMHTMKNSTNAHMHKCQILQQQ